MKIKHTQPFVTLFQLSGHLIILLVLCLLSSAAICADGTRLTLKASVAVDHDQVRLSDIATLSGASTDKLTSLGRIVVAKSPLPGQTRFVGVDYVRIRLKQAGVNTAALLIDGPSDVRVSRRAVALPAGRIRRAVETAIRNRMPWANQDVTISRITFDESVNLPPGKLSFRIMPGRNEDYLGRTVMALHLFVDGQPVRKIWVNATIAVMADVVTVVKPLGKHRHIELDDLSVQRRDLASLPSDTVGRIEDALGNRTTRMIYPNTVLQSRMIASPPLVKRGDMVKIVAQLGPMTITATGLVKQQGRKGEMVRVVNTDSKRIVTARVTGPGAVSVEF